MRGVSYIIIIAGVLSACSEAPVTNGSAASSSVKTPPVLLKPNYASQDGDVYVYQAGLSQDDKDAGKAAGELISYKYLGAKDGAHTLALLNDDDQTMGRATCTNPCSVIKVKIGDSTDRIAFSDQSVLGSAFEDAFKGHLKVASPKK